MTDLHTQIEHLKAAIRRKQADVMDLEAEIIDLERDLQSISTRYTQLIEPKIKRLEIIKRMIKDLEQEIARQAPPAHPVSNPLHSTWTPPKDYVPVEEQFYRTWKAPREAGRSPFEKPPIIPHDQLPRDDNGTRDELKQLYRQLARRYHPDLSTDPDERARRNRLMAEINAAYADGDLDALRALAAQPASAPPDEPLAAIQLRQLEQIHQQLTDRLIALRQERHDLLNGDMMWIKIQSRLAQREGRDYLQEMAAHLDAEYNAYLDRLDELKRQL